MKNSFLFWITGLSGSGKTTFANILVDQLNKNNKKTILLDGDVIRDIFGNNNDYSREERLKTAYQYSKLSAFLLKNDINVVCSTISLFHEIHEYNEKNIKNYLEVFLKVDFSELEKRDSKQIYSKAKNNKLKNVVGIDIAAEFPNNPDLIIENAVISDLEKYAKKLIEMTELK